MKNLFILFLLAGFFGCNSYSDPVAEETFSTIFDDGSFRQYEAVDIIQTQDSGYLILGSYSLTTGSEASEDRIPFLLKTNSRGQIVWESSADTALANYSAPVPRLSGDENQYGFFVAKTIIGNSKAAALLSVNDLTGEWKELYSTAPARFQPKYTVWTEDRALVLNGTSFECKGIRGDPAVSVLKIAPTTGTVLWKYCLPGGRNPETVSRLKDEFYFCEEAKMDTGTVYVFNAAIDDDDGIGMFALSANGDSLGAISEYPIAPIALSHIRGNVFAASFTNDNDVDITAGFIWDFTNPDQDPKLSSIFHEIPAGQKVVIRSGTIEGKKVNIYALPLRTGQIGLYIFDAGAQAESGLTLLLGKTILGASNGYRPGGMVLTNDGGLAVLGKTFVADRYNKLCLFKLSAAEVNALL